MKTLQIFKAGNHTAMSGQQLAFGESDLLASVKAYDPALSEAPIVVGHPKTDLPAYGWVKSLQYADGALEAQPIQVDPQFAELVAKGHYKKISAAFYAPDAPNNPVPGVYYLRHVGFLGAQPPAVKGLRNPEFSENEPGIVEFADWSDVQNASLWRRLRDWLIGEKGMEVADNVIPAYAVADLETEARREEPQATPLFAEPTQGDPVTPEQKAALEAENAQLKQRLAEADARDKAAKAAQLHAENTAFAEGLVSAGKLLPAHKALAVATLDHLANQPTVVEFGEGNAKQSLVAGFKAFLTAQPKQVEFGEVAGDTGQPHTVSFAAPSGFTVDTGRLDMHSKALAYQTQHKVSYDAALAAVCPSNK